MKAYTVISPAPRDAWEELYRSDPFAVPYQSPIWFDSMCATGSFEDASRYYLSADGNKRMVLPLVRQKLLPGPLSIQESMPHGWGMGGVLSSFTLNTEDIRFVIDDLEATPSLSISLRPNPLHAELWAAARTPGMVAVPRTAHVLDLEGGSDAVWTKRFSSDTRNKIRKAQKSNIEVEHDTTGRLIPVFYDLLRLSFDRWAQQQNEPVRLARWRGERRDPLRKFETIAKHLGAACNIWVARVEGQPAAAILVLTGTNVNYSRGAMDKALVGITRANELLQWTAIEHACQIGARHYHMGETGSSEMLADFKSKFGAQAVPYAEYRIDRLPITKIDHALRSTVKRMIGFRD